MGKNVIVFEADMSSYKYIDNKNKDILIPGEGPTQGLDNTTLTAEENMLFILHSQEKNWYYVCTIIQATVSYFFMLQKYIISKQKTLK